MQLGCEFDTIIDSVEVVSKYVVKFNLVQPFGPFLPLLASQACAIVNPDYAGGWKTVWTPDDIVYYEEGDVRASHTMDLGPYKLTEWTRVAGKDHEMRLEANPNYWNKGAGLPKTDVVIIKFYADATALRLAIEAGDIDVAFRHITATDIEDLKDNPNVKVWQGVGAAIQYMIFQEDPVGTLPQLNDSRIRRALTACLDRQEVCNTVFLGQASPLYSILPDGMLGHTEAFAALGDANYTYAISELADLGYNETNKLEIELWYESSGHYPSSGEQAAIYKSQFEASGVISVTLKSADWPSYRMNRNDGTMHVFLYGWYPDYIDPDNYAFLYYAVWLNHHYIDHGEHYAEMKAAYDAARASSDESERISLYAEIDDYAVLDCPVVPIWQGAAWAVTKPNIKGVYLDITQSWRMWYLYSTPPDSNPPTTTVSLSGVPGTNGWFTSDVTVTLPATDDISGVDKTEYSFDNVTWNTYAMPLTITNEGYSIVYCKSTDKAGNVETIRTETIKIDKTIPTANAGVDRTVAEDTLVTFDGSASWDENDIASYTWTFTDITPQTLSGENTTYTFTTPGTYIVTLTVEDAAGNTANDTVTITVLLDTDRDETPDTTDTDDDNDGINDDEDAFPLDPTESVDTDEDGVGDNSDTDDDNDGIPDTWETENGLNPLDAADASLDPDGDGLANLQEYQGDTDPNVSDAEAVPLWILGAIAAVVIGIAVATAAFLLRRRK